VSTLLWVGLGGALGALCRYTWSAAFVAGERFPWATLTINIAGSFLIGLAWGAWSQEGWFNTWGRAFLVTGVLGGFTTFSAFSLETIALAEAGRVVTALIYVVASVVVCLVAAWVGQRLVAG
jgi:CrcB protein